MQHSPTRRLFRPLASASPSLSLPELTFIQARRWVARFALQNTLNYTILAQILPDRTSVSMSGDPFTIIMQPPPDETLEELQVREENEKAAKLRSENIDQYLKLSIKRDKVTKLLLLGLSAIPHHIVINI